MRLIDADELKHLFYRESCDVVYTDDDYAEFGYSLDSVFGVIESATTIDSSPVVHAHWIKDFIKIGNNDWKYKCSKCGKYNKQYSPPFCPNCGAMMDEKIQHTVFAAVLPHCGAKMDEEDDGHDASRSD